MKDVTEYFIYNVYRRCDCPDHPSYNNLGQVSTGGGGGDVAG